MPHMSSLLRAKDAEPNATWLGGLSKRPQGPILGLEFGKDMYSSDGWVLGSAPDNNAADVQLAEDNTKGVSKRHFRIDIHPLSCKPRVTVLSRSLHFVGDGDDDLLTQHEDREITESAVFNLGGTVFLAWRPKLTPREVRTYRKKALKFSEDAALAMPRYFPLLSSAPETITSKVRYGENEKVYVFQGHSGKGTSASVILVQERKSGDILAAKEPYYKSSDDPGIRRNRWEELNKESDYLSRLDHVARGYCGIILASPRICI
ncbi:hypothetical protein BKA67DRAFT_562791 [Truncatella angustata]|uniref:FHA domain-containing protein n=1 Tax=Truncatella angustata TaxID=152316 RepID=A0A9P8UPY4_9PEZI|nr:uncharacterized protein BKA67DRAFT_562791 [Truncatella angustata]KAH6656160.1 hypothetical protein BKA67DRAFT_562791 [Truncatella angustata]KAH8194091.1 hypothetical protein TruAng_011741 [Truncatella angustata]